MYNQSPKGFTLVELLVTMVLCATFFTAASLVHQSFAQNRSKLQAYDEVTLSNPTLGSTPEEVLSNFYGFSDRSSLTVYTAPNYGGRSPVADIMRERMFEDADRSIGVFPLPRTALNTVRPTSLPIETTMTAMTVQNSIDFLQILSSTSAYPIANNIYSPVRNISSSCSASLYILQSSSTENTVGIRAIWEWDFLDTTSPPGVYASVRRYVGSQLTDYYDVFYPNASNTWFGPLFAIFERRARLNITETYEDRYKKAKNQPFMFIWWPDPGITLRNESVATSVYDPAGATASDPRSDYYNMGIKTGCFLTVPIFPPL